jgi:Ser/Thr protein kinase RdoA (MazF antagonist)
MVEIINNFCNEYGLGGVLALRPVFGGLLHKMYRVETESGTYAVKVLNTEIMQRPQALQNTINSEKVAHSLENLVPVVAAKEFDKDHVVEHDGTWFMVFDWLEGASVFAPDITVEHCAKIGEMLGKIHGANVNVEGMERSAEVREAFSWDNALVEAFAEILALDTDVVCALKQMSDRKVISHRDLDPKNVMWQADMPYIIDWEAAGYVNPYQELVEVLNYWITDVNGNYNYEKFEALMEAYKASMDVSSVDWDSVLLCSFDGMLGWLEYNMRRAAGLLGNDEADRMEGRKQVEGTIAEIKRQKAQMVQLRRWLYEFR